MQPIVDHEFIAHGEIYRDDTSVPVIIRGTYSAFEPKPVHCIVVPETDRWPEGFSAFDDSYRLAKLRGDAHDGEKVWISALTEVSTSHSGDRMHWEGIAEFFVKGDLDEFDATGGEIVCSVFIPATPIAFANVGYTRSYDGTIEMKVYEGAREGVHWNTKLGAAELIDNYRYVDNKIGIDEATIRIRRCEVTIRARDIAQTSLGAILKDLPELLDDTLWLVSFLGRRRITWYAGEAYFFPGDGPTRSFAHAIVHRQRSLGYEGRMGYGESKHDLLISPEKLRQGLFQEMLAKYENSAHRDVIRKTIPYILMSYERGYLEAHIGNAYLALETMVAGFGSEDRDQNLSSSDFKQLKKKIEQVIQQEVKNPETAQNIVKKLGELNRPAILDRLMTLLKAHNVAAAKLWPAGADIRSELHEILKRRNLYIHQGRIDDYHQYLFDFVRLRNLVELWIIKLLDCPDDAINSLALNNLVKISDA